jgi:hypothetical protein
MAATVPPLNGDNNPKLGLQKYRREFIIAGITFLVSLMAFGLIYQFFLRLPQIDIDNTPQQEAVKLIYSDAYWFHQLYMRWTVVDWVLTFLATGTAISAVIKNSYSVKSAATAYLSPFDKILIILAVLTVLETTFDGKLHAGQLADKYRYGDLILQGAKIDYAASQKTNADKEALRQKWHDAQDYLASPVQAVQKTPAGTPATNPSPGQPSQRSPVTPDKQPDVKGSPANPSQGH